MRNLSGVQSHTDPQLSQNQNTSKQGLTVEFPLYNLSTYSYNTFSFLDLFFHYRSISMKRQTLIWLPSSYPTSSRRALAVLRPLPSPPCSSLTILPSTALQDELFYFHLLPRLHWGLRCQENWVKLEHEEFVREGETPCELRMLCQDKSSLTRTVTIDQEVVESPTLEYSDVVLRDTV